MRESQQMTKGQTMKLMLHFYPMSGWKKEIVEALGYEPSEHKMSAGYCVSMSLFVLQCSLNSFTVSIH